MQDLHSLQYPIGEFVLPENPSAEDIKKAIQDLEYFPTWIESLIENMDEPQLHTTYREGGWTVAQVVHHCADSHMNCLIRIKLALSEDEPTIKPYFENLWAEMKDYELPINNSTTLLHCVHKKIVSILLNCTALDMARTYIHPQYQKTYTVRDVLFLYAWHCRHHFAHIHELKKRMEW